MNSIDCAAVMIGESMGKLSAAQHLIKRRLPVTAADLGAVIRDLHNVGRRVERKLQEGTILEGGPYGKQRGKPGRKQKGPKDAAHGEAADAASHRSNVP